jgi:hypothetical protein
LRGGNCALPTWWLAVIFQIRHACLSRTVGAAKKLAVRFNIMSDDLQPQWAQIGASLLIAHSKLSKVCRVSATITSNDR